MVISAPLQCGRDERNKETSKIILKKSSADSADI